MSSSENDDRTFDQDALKQALSETLYNDPEPDSDSEPRLFDEDEPDSSSEAGPAPFVDEDESPLPVGSGYGDKVRIPINVPDMNLSESNNTPPSPAAENSHKGNGGGISRIFMVVVALAVAGFTAANWIASQKIDALSVQFEQLKAEMADSENSDRAKTTDNSEQASSEILMQLATQITENREAIKSLQQAMTASTSPNSDTPVKKERPEKATKTVASSSNMTPKVAPKKVTAVEKPNKPAAQEKSKPTAIPAAKQATPSWGVVITSLKNEAMADREIAALKQKGYTVMKHTVTVKGSTFHQLRMGSFEKKEDAIKYMKSTVRSLGYKDAWISRQ